MSITSAFPAVNARMERTKWDSDVLGYISAIYKEAGKQEQYWKQRPEELEKLER